MAKSLHPIRVALKVPNTDIKLAINLLGNIRETERREREREKWKERD